MEQHLSQQQQHGAGHLPFSCAQSAGTPGSAEQGSQIKRGVFLATDGFSICISTKQTFSIHRRPFQPLECP